MNTIYSMSLLSSLPGQTGSDRQTWEDRMGRLLGNKKEEGRQGLGDRHGCMHLACAGMRQTAETYILVSLPPPRIYMTGHVYGYAFLRAHGGSMALLSPGLSTASLFTMTFFLPHLTFSQTTCSPTLPPVSSTGQASLHLHCPPCLLSLSSDLSFPSTGS